ncbi:MAG: peptide chain release factor N(5)-glutamine methyltransferase [Thermoleophilaceae bacterium]
MSGAGPVRDALAAATGALAAAGCDTPQLDAEVLIADALGVDRGALVTGASSEVPAAAARAIGESVRRRVMREPVAYILGRTGFRHIDLVVDSRVLIPRPETELLVEVALSAPRGARVHDVGTGSGAVALALMHERPDLRVSASDSSPGAIDVARANARALGLDLPLAVARGLPHPIAFGEPKRAYDLVLANLPYVSIGELAALAPEIRTHEPHCALVSGQDGLDAIRDLIEEIPAGTRVALEHSPRQARAVRGLLDAAETHCDLAGRERVTAGTAR